MNMYIDVTIISKRDHVFGRAAWDTGGNRRGQMVGSDVDAMLSYKVHNKNI